MPNNPNKRGWNESYRSGHLYKITQSLFKKEKQRRESKRTQMEKDTRTKRRIHMSRRRNGRRPTNSERR